MTSLLRTFPLAILLTLLLASTAHAILKQILGAALLGDVIPAFYSLKCLSSTSNFTSFLLYARTHPDDPRPLIPNDWKSLQKSDFDASLPTKIIIHGFVDNQRLSDWMMKMKNALLRNGDYNVIITDWSCGNGFPYIQAVTNARKTAESLGDLIQFLKETRGANPKDFHLIGHSLGSQISGIVGHRIKGLGRITALDPAGPKFYNAPLEKKLDPSDAAFVDVIHTDGGNGLFEGLGLRQQVGHVDFYPNGGRTQPGCHSSPFSVLPRIGLQRAARYYLTCDHYRAIDFYIESIGATKKRDEDLYCDYVGVKCRDWKAFSEGRCDCSSSESCAIMGFYSDMYPHGNPQDGANEFFVMTSENDPYCMHQYQIIFETGGSSAEPRQASSEFDSGINIGAIHLEVKTGSGKVSRLSLNDRGEDMMQPSKKYVYLAASKYPLGEIQSASLWYGKKEKPTSEHSSLSLPFGFKLKKIEIKPIVAQSQLQGRILAPSKIVLCGDEEKVVSRTQLFHLSVNNC